MPHRLPAFAAELAALSPDLLIASNTQAAGIGLPGFAKTAIFEAVGTISHDRGAYRDREAEWARQEADIIAAGREGRVLNPDRISK